MNNMTKVVLTLLLLASLTSLSSAVTYEATTAAQIISSAAAAGSGDRIHVAAGTYIMSSGINLKSGVTIYGDGSSQTILKMVNGFDAFHSTSNIAMFMIGSGVSNVEIYGFTVNGGCTSLSQMHAAANTYRDTNRGVMMRTGSSHITIHDMYFTLAMGDSIHGGDADYVTIYNCQMDTPGHDAIDVWGGDHWTVSNVMANLFINTGFKIAGASDIQLSHSTFYSDTGSGYCGVQIMQAVSGIVIDHNIFGPMGTSVRQGVATHTANGAVSGTVTISNNIFYACSGGNIVTSGITLTNVGNQYPTARANWVGQGYGFDSSKLGSNSGAGEPVDDDDTSTNTTDEVVILAAYNGSHLPAMTYPLHNSAIQSVNGQIAFAWENVNSTKYAVEAATSNSFSNDTIIFETLVDNGETVLAETLTNGTYYWRLAAYDDVHNQWTDYASANKFTITGDEVVGVGGIAGVVFDSVSGRPINNSIVYLYSNFWSGSCVSGENGVYAFSDISSGIQYTILATAQNYLSSPQLPITLNGSSVTQDMPLQKASSYFAPNYVSITVSAPWGVAYSNVEINVYSEGNNPTDYQPDYSSTTDDNGQVIFPLDKAIPHYTITAYSPIQNIDKQVRISPNTANVQIWVWNAIKLEESTNYTVNTEPKKYAFSDVLACEAVWMRNSNNTTCAFINESFAAIDGVSTITAWSTTIYEVDQKNGTMKYGANNQSTYMYYTSGVGDASISVSVPTNRSYRVHTEITDSLIDNVYIYDKQLDTRSTIMQGFDLGWREQWNYELVGLLLLFLMGGLFGARSAGVGAVLVLLMGWFFEYIGWFVWSTGDMLMASFGIILVIAYFLLNGR